MNIKKPRSLGNPAGRGGLISSIAGTMIGLARYQLYIAVNAPGTAGLAATIETVERLGNITFAYVNIGLPDLLTVQIMGDQHVSNGQEVQLNLTPSTLHVFDETGTALR